MTSQVVFTTGKLRDNFDTGVSELGEPYTLNMEGIMIAAVSAILINSFFFFYNNYITLSCH